VPTLFLKAVAACCTQDE